MLTEQPATDVVLTILSSDTSEATVSPATLTFTLGNWNLPKTVTVTGANDSIVDGSQVSTITLAVDDLNSDNRFEFLS